MVVNWQDKTVQDRLLTAVIASVDKISAAEIARLYGENMTYHAVENYLRRFRKDAKEMKDEAADRAGPVPSPARPRVTKKASTVSSSKAGANVKGGRVAKKKTLVKIKAEVLENEVNDTGHDMGSLGGHEGMEDDEV